MFRRHLPVLIREILRDMVPAVDRFRLEQVQHLIEKVFALIRQRPGTLCPGGHDRSGEPVGLIHGHGTIHALGAQLLVLALDRQGGYQAVHQIRRLEKGRHKPVHPSVVRRQILDALLAGQEVTLVKELGGFDIPNPPAGGLHEVRRRLRHGLSIHFRQQLGKLCALIEGRGEISCHLGPGKGRH